MGHVIIIEIEMKVSPSVRPYETVRSFCQFRHVRIDLSTSKLSGIIPIAVRYLVKREATLYSISKTTRFLEKLCFFQEFFFSHFFENTFLDITYERVYKNEGGVIMTILKCKKLFQIKSFINTFLSSAVTL